MSWLLFTHFSFFPHRLQSVQSAIAFLSCWQIYVVRNGEPVRAIVIVVVDLCDILFLGNPILDRKDPSDSCLSSP